ncbi:MAG: hypothetical protein HOJ41_08715 [Rhodospirillaceae bacterium]|nr:hypothetical protein [Rhodospirillaceae bacterium]
MLGSVGAALAHHGWRWTTGGNIEVTGIITAAQLGNPHGVLTVDADGQVWRVEVGQPWRNERAGLKDGDLKKGVEVRIVGEPSADIKDKRVKAERLYLGKKEYKLYPERD